MNRRAIEKGGWGDMTVAGTREPRFARRSGVTNKEGQSGLIEEEREKT